MVRAAWVLALCGLGAPGCSDPVVRIGAVVSESGPAAAYGASVRRGLELAAAQIAEAGGIDGRRLVLSFRDDGSDPTTALIRARELEDEGARLLVGAVTSPATLALAPFCEARRIVLLSPTSSAPQITDAGGYVFRNYPSDVTEGASMADLARDLGVERVVVMAVDNAFGRGLRDVFTERFRETYRREVRERLYPEGGAAAIPAGELATGFAPQGFYLVGYQEDAAALLRGLRSAGLGGVRLGCSSLTPEIARQAGEAAEGLIFPQPRFDPGGDDPAVRRFVEAYRARFGEEPDAFAAYAYDALRLLALAVDRAGTSGSEQVRESLAAIDDYRGATGRIGFDGNGDVVQPPRLMVVRGGRAVPYEALEEAPLR